MKVSPLNPGKPIHVRVPQSCRLDPTQLDRVFVENTSGKRIPLSELVRIKSKQRDRPILHKDNERVTFVGGELSRIAPVYAIVDLDKKLDGLDIGNGYFLKTRNLSIAPVSLIRSTVTNCYGTEKFVSRSIRFVTWASHWH